MRIRFTNKERFHWSGNKSWEFAKEKIWLVIFLAPFDEKNKEITIKKTQLKRRDGFMEVTNRILIKLIFIADKYVNIYIYQTQQKCHYKRWKLYIYPSMTREAYSGAVCVY